MSNQWTDDGESGTLNLAGWLPHYVAQVRNDWETLNFHPWNPQTFEAFRRLVHNLAGSGSMLGFSAAGRAARVLDQCLVPILAAGQPPSLEQQEQIRSLLDKLEKTVPGSPAQAAGEGATEKLVYLVEDDPRLARELSSQISVFGYATRILLAPQDLVPAMSHGVPAVIILDVSSPEQQLAGAQVIAALSIGRTPIPIIFISAREDFTARLEAVRAGANAYLVKPVDVNFLVDRLDLLTARQVPDPFRILLIVHSPQLAGEAARQLEQAGMRTMAVPDPMQIMSPLLDFRPDLIIMDLHLPHCSGLELAAVIRQQNDLVGIPIVYLSAETDLDQQLEAIRLSGDDFLTTPVRAENLISSVIARSQRSRILRSNMVRDSLTNLLNHTALKERLDIELARARRQGYPVAYAMLDLDHFKRINDSFGHAAGDGVLKSLAHVLQQRLRKTDAIGRYGGEEFVAILPDADGPNAARVLDQIRSGFAQVRHQSPAGDFTVTFSCGVAVFPQCGDAVALGDSADKALYEAKNGGRNRVVQA